MGPIKTHQSHAATPPGAARAAVAALRLHRAGRAGGAGYWHLSSGKTTYNLRDGSESSEGQNKQSITVHELLAPRLLLLRGRVGRRCRQVVARRIVFLLRLLLLLLLLALGIPIACSLCSPARVCVCLLAAAPLRAAFLLRAALLCAAVVRRPLIAVRPLPPPPALAAALCSLQQGM